MRSIVFFTLIISYFSTLCASDFTINVLSQQGVSKEITLSVQNPVVAIDKFGNAVAAFQNVITPTINEQAIIAFRPAGELVWQQQQVISDFTGNEVEQVHIAMNPSGRGVVVWEQKNNQIHSAIFQVSNNTFTVEGNINVSGDFRGDIQSAPQVVMTKEGTALCVWEDHNTDPWKLAAAILPQGSNTWVAIPEYVSAKNIVQSALEVHLNINCSNQGILSWRTTILNGNGGPVFARRFTIDGDDVTFGPILQVSPLGAQDQLHIAQGIDGDGNIFIGWSNQDFGVNPQTISAAILGSNDSSFINLGTISDNTTSGNNASNLNVFVTPSGYGALAYETVQGSIFISTFFNSSSVFSFIDQNVEISTTDQTTLSDPMLYVDSNKNIAMTLRINLTPSEMHLLFFKDFLEETKLTSQFEDHLLSLESDGANGSAPLAFNCSGEGVTAWQKATTTNKTSGIQGASLFIYSPTGVLLNSNTRLQIQQGFR